MQNEPSRHGSITKNLFVKLIICLEFALFRPRFWVGKQVVVLRDEYIANTEVIMKGDYCTREGAERLKNQIEAYWAERGLDVKINLVQAGFLPSMRSARTDVRSNMINGVPTANSESFA